MIKKTFIFALLIVFLSSIVSAHHIDEHEGVNDAEWCEKGELCERESESVVDELIDEKINRAAVVSVLIWFVASLAVVMRSFRQKKKLKVKKQVLKSLFNVVFIGIIALIGFSYYYYDAVASETIGITICEAGECFWAAHIHSYLDLQVCGESKELGLEVGHLEAVHTHKERNKLHFHERLPVDPETMEVSDYSLLTLGSFFENVGVTFSSECFFDKCNGDLCNGVTGSVSMTVNGVDNSEFESYVWSDDDQIIIKFE